MENNKVNGKMMLSHEPEGLTVKQLKANALKKWYWFLIIGAFCVAGAYFYTKITPTTYRINSTLLIKNDSKANELTAIFQDVRLNRQNPAIQDQIGVLKSFSLNLKTMQHLNWQYSWFKKDFLTYTDLYGNDPFHIKTPKDAAQLNNIALVIKPESDDHYIVKCDAKRKVNGIEIPIQFEKRVAFGEAFKNDYFNFVLEARGDRVINTGDEYLLIFNNLSTLAMQYKDRLGVQPSNEESNLLVLGLETTQLARDVEYLNRLASFYIQYGLEEKNRQANNTVRFIDNLIAGVTDSLQTAGNTFTNFRSRNRTVDLGQEATSVVEKIRTIDNELSQLNLKLEYYTNLKYYLDNKEEIKDLVAPSMVGVTDDDMTALVTKLNDLYSKREVLSYTVQEKNPTLVSLNNEIAYTQKVLSEKMENTIANTHLELNNLKARQQRVNSELSRLPKTEQQMIGMKRNYDLNNELFTFLLQRRAEAEIARASNNPDAQILDPAAMDIAELVGPIKSKAILLGVGVSIMLSVLLVIASEYFSEKLTATEEISSKLEFPITATVSENKFKSELPVLQYPRSAITESFRGLRINLQNLSKDPHQNVLAIHSTISGEGKSFVASNIAMVFAISNKKVLLIDGDLRQPRVHSIMKTKNEIGLSTYLAGKAKIEDIIQPTFQNNLFVAPAGPTPSSPSELLANGSIATFIERVRDKFDFIVFDNAPYGVVSDAMVIGLQADINMFLLRMNYSKKEFIDSINKVNHEGILRNILVTINGVKQIQGYGYYNDDMKRKKETKVTS
jgi:tyrosine-protein kinase Etk/Wzc